MARWPSLVRRLAPHEIIALDDDGKSESVVQLPFSSFQPISIDWLRDGRLLIVYSRDDRLLRKEFDGSVVTHADLSGLTKGWNEIVVDGRGNIYVNSVGFDSHRIREWYGRHTR